MVVLSHSRIALIPVIIHQDCSSSYDPDDLIPKKTGARYDPIILPIYLSLQRSFKNFCVILISSFSILSWLYSVYSIPSKLSHHRNKEACLLAKFSGQFSLSLSVLLDWQAADAISRQVSSVLETFYLLSRRALTPDPPLTSLPVFLAGSCSDAPPCKLWSLLALDFLAPGVFYSFLVF